MGDGGWQIRDMCAILFESAQTTPALQCHSIFTVYKEKLMGTFALTLHMGDNKCERICDMFAILFQTNNAFQ